MPQPPRHPGQAVKELQTSTREAIVLLKAMIEEVRNSASQEETAINALFSGMQVGDPAGQRTPPCAHGCPRSPLAQCRGAAEPWDVRHPCRLQEQLSERKKALLKAVQR